MSDAPKKYLAWDTSSVVGAICAFETKNEGKGAVLHRTVSWSLSLETSRHSERLLWSIHSVLEAAGWKLKDLSGIAVGIGPGSFTGLRIGITTAKILASTLKIPLTPLSSLALLARGALSPLELLPRKEKVLLIACTDAAKGEWFTLMGDSRRVRDCIAMADGDLSGIWGQGVLEGVMEPQAVFDEIRKRLNKDPALKWMAVGQSVLRYAEEWSALPKKSRLQVFLTDAHRIQEEVLARTAFEAVQQGLLRESGALRPRYLRASEAEVNLKKGILKPSPVLHRAGTG
jgi:tRNA threonylcarbamoyladenosine biosynthesis protein TsaB